MESFIFIFQIVMLQPKSLPKKQRVIIKNIFFLFFDIGKYQHTYLDIMTLYTSSYLILINFYAVDKNHPWTYRERDSAWEVCPSW